MKKYEIYKAGSTKVCALKNTCITKAIKEFMKTLEKPAKYELHNKFMARIYYKDNYSISSDFVIMEV